MAGSYLWKKCDLFYESALALVHFFVNNCTELGAILLAFSLV